MSELKRSKFWDVSIGWRSTAWNSLMTTEMHLGQEHAATALEAISLVAKIRQCPPAEEWTQVEVTLIEYEHY
jgi:hypothetical protein